MRNLLRVLPLLLLAIATLPAHSATPTGEIVVAMRYLVNKGESHAHLYLYREDGKLLRQLTDEASGQDSTPIFSPDGETIVWTHTGPDGSNECWSIQPRGNGRQKVTAPAWYNDAKSSSSFEHTFNGPPILPEPRPSPHDARTISTADGHTQAAIISASGEDDAPSRWDVTLKTPCDATPRKVGELGGFSAGFLSRADDDASQCTLEDGALSVTFCFVHLNSSDGNTVHALDLETGTLTPLSPNFATPFPLPREPAFLTLTENRFVPFGDGQHTANCSYVERWDTRWKPIRYAKEATRGVCYGASMYRQGKEPTVIRISP